MKHRVLMVSDMHYTSNLSRKEGKEISPEVDISIASGDAFGYTQEEKIAKINEAIDAEQKIAPLDCVLVLGDLSIDDYSARHLPWNYCEKFRDECMKKMPCPSYAIAGNHDSYPDEMWVEMFGYHRQFSVPVGDVVFIMMDTFKGYPAKDASGAKFTDADMDFLKSEMTKYPGKKFILCSHWFRRDTNPDFSKEVETNPAIVGLFYGHAHNARLEEMSGKPFVDIGGYAYNGMVIDGKYTFSIFDRKWSWGYEMLEWEDGDEIRFWHHRPPILYKAANGVFDEPDLVTNEGNIKLS